MKVRNEEPVVYRAPETVWLFLDDVEAKLENGAIQVGEKLFMQKVTDDTLKALQDAELEGARKLIGHSKLMIECREATDGLEQALPLKFVRALVVGSKAHIIPGAMITLAKNRRAIQVPPTRDPYGVCWGHYDKVIGEDEVIHSSKLFPGILSTDSDEVYHRVGNALQFYMNGYYSRGADFALVAFTTCLEALFSTSEQELSFRLSLRVAQFLAEGRGGQRTYYDKAREVYKVRSKVVHGAALDKNTERAAIYLVEGIVPAAEELARLSLEKVFNLGLEKLFQRSESVEALFEELLFADSLDDALKKLRWA
jgi:hypothetical protein